jgi:hypothetical protein
LRCRSAHAPRFRKIGSRLSRPALPFWLAPRFLCREPDRHAPSPMVLLRRFIRIPAPLRRGFFMGEYPGSLTWGSYVTAHAQAGRSGMCGTAGTGPARDMPAAGFVRQGAGVVREAACLHH